MHFSVLKRKGSARPPRATLDFSALPAEEMQTAAKTSLRCASPNDHCTYSTRQRPYFHIKSHVGDARICAQKSTGLPTAPVLARYRCFLPDLAGLAGLRRVGPGISNFSILRRVRARSAGHIPGQTACAKNRALSLCKIPRPRQPSRSKNRKHPPLRIDKEIRYH